MKKPSTFAITTSNILPPLITITPTITLFLSISDVCYFTHICIGQCIKRDSLVCPHLSARLHCGRVAVEWQGHVGTCVHVCGSRWCTAALTVMNELSHHNPSHALHPFTLERVECVYTSLTLRNSRVVSSFVIDHANSMFAIMYDCINVCIRNSMVWVGVGVFHPSLVCVVV